MSEPTPARTSRNQFGIRTLLVLMLLVALFMWWWVQLPTGFISEAETRKVKVGQTRDEVEDLLGKPLEEHWRTTPPQMHYAAYRVVRTKPEVRALVINFDYETHIVTGITREARNYAMFTLEY